MLAVEALVIDCAVFFPIYKTLSGVRVQIDQLVACAGKSHVSIISKRL